MRRPNVFVAAVLALVAVVGACSLNPQPIPPLTPDGSITGADAAGGVPDATFGDVGSGEDSAMPPNNDAAADSTADVVEDVVTDAPSDSPDEANDAGDAATDATIE